MTIEKAVDKLIEEWKDARKQEFVNDPVAYALHQVWKEAEEERRKRMEEE